jgi:hypothetical protein
MAGAIYSIAELNTIITMLGCLCATVQAVTGAYSSVYKKRTALIKINPILNHTHRTFGAYSTVLYLLGLFAGASGFIGAFLGISGSPPLEFNDPSFYIHVWASFPIAVIILAKTILSYTNKKYMYRNGKWFGMATYIAWAYTWVTSAVSYYVRTLNPPLPTIMGEPFPPPIILLPTNLFLLQIFIPFLVGGLISIPVILRVEKALKNKAKNSKK